MPTVFNLPMTLGVPSLVSQQLEFGLSVVDAEMQVILRSSTGLMLTSKRFLFLRYVAVTAVHWSRRDVVGKQCVALTWRLPFKAIPRSDQ